MDRGACVSVDTTSDAVAAACLDAGACVVNDVSCLAHPSLAGAVAASGAAFVLMHARGTQAAMAGFSVYPDDAYADVVDDVATEWAAAAARAMAAGVPREGLVMDPGLGFKRRMPGRASELLRRTRELVARVGVPVAVGASRKSFLTAAVGDAKPSDRLGASVAAALVAAEGGASLLRVHDVRATAQALDLARAVARER